MKNPLTTSNFDFMGKRKLFSMISIVLILICLGSIFFRGLNLGVDFTGGTIIEAHFANEVSLNEIRQQLSQNGYEKSSVQYFGNNTDVLIRLQNLIKEDASLSSKILAIISQVDANVEIRRIEFVGPQLGQELTDEGGLAFLYALIGILIYVAIRFEYRFAFASVLALIHDVLISVGIYSIIGLEFDLTVLAALLAVIGYSLNDTIVVFDRIREKSKEKNKNSIIEIINNSINSMLTRTLVTSLTTLFVLICLLIIGGSAISGFSIILIIGVIVGTYSSVFIAGSAALAFGVDKESLLPSEKEQKQLNSRP